MIYRMDSRIKFHEVGEDRYLDLPSLIDLLQDCGNLHGEDNGATLDYQFRVGQAWVIVSWQLKIEDWPYLGDHVTTSTWAYRYRQFMASRNFTVKSPEGKVYVKADSQWVMLNIATQKPERVRPEIVEMYGVHPEEKLPDSFPGRVIRVAENGVTEDPIVVAPHMLDTNHHVNNGVYVRLASKYIPRDFRYNRFGAEYAAQARLGDTMIPRIARLENGWQVALMQENEKPFFVAQWEMKDESC